MQHRFFAFISRMRFIARWGIFIDYCDAASAISHKCAITGGLKIDCGVQGIISQSIHGTRYSPKVHAAVNISVFSYNIPYNSQFNAWKHEG